MTCSGASRGASRWHHPTGHRATRGYTPPGGIVIAELGLPCGDPGPERAADFGTGPLVRSGVGGWKHSSTGGAGRGPQQENPVLNDPSHRAWGTKRISLMHWLCISGLQINQPSKQRGWSRLAPGVLGWGGKEGSAHKRPLLHATEPRHLYQRPKFG